MNFIEKKLTRFHYRQGSLFTILHLNEASRKKMKILCLNQVVKSGQNSWFQKLKAFFAQGFSGIFLGSYSFLTSTTVFLSVRHNLVFHIIVSKIWKWKIWYSFFLKILKGMHPIARDSRDSQGGKICASNGWQFIFMLVYIF